MMGKDGSQSTTKHVYYGTTQIVADCVQGLGTSTSADAIKYFSALDKHRIGFEAMTPDDRLLIDMAFNKKKADDRKEWLRQYKVSA